MSEMTERLEACAISCAKSKDGLLDCGEQRARNRAVESRIRKLERALRELAEAVLDDDPPHDPYVIAKHTALPLLKGARP